MAGQRDFYREGLADVKSAIRFHLEILGTEALDLDEPVLETSVAEASDSLNLR